jgi:hypothetical protein
VTCERCYGPLDEGEHGLYRCPLRPRRAAAVRPDSIPGGLTIEHGLCDEQGNPVTYYSQTDITRACEAKGMRRWSDYYSEDRTRDAREQIAWQQSGEAKRLTARNQDAKRQREHEEQRRSQGERRR